MHMPRDRNQREILHDPTYMNEDPKIVKLTELETRIVVARDGGGEGTKGKLLINRHKVLLMQDEFFLEACCVALRQ